MNLAIVENSEIIIDYKINKSGQTHSAIILPALKNILNSLEITLNDISGIAVAIGPGSFTGIRIGLSTAKGLAFALSLPIIGINSLDAYTFTWQNLSGILCPLIVARKGEYYYTLYHNKDNRLVMMRDYQCKEWFEIKQELFKYKEKENIYVFGYGMKEIIEEDRMGNDKKIANLHFLKNNHNITNAANVAILGEVKFLKKQYDDIYKLMPFYISKSAAEVNREKEDGLCSKKR